MADEHSTALVQIVPLALGAAVSPVIFLLQLTTLTSPRPIARASALTAGAATALIVVSTIGVLVRDTGPSAANNRWLQVVLGLGFGIWLLVKGAGGL